MLSLVLCGNQPYAWNLDSPTAHAVAAAIAASRQEGMFGAALVYRCPEPERRQRGDQRDHDVTTAVLAFAPETTETPR